MADATWLYAVVGADTFALPAGLRGVAGEPVRCLPGGELTAVVGSVGLAEFAEEPLRRAFTDAGWVERVARAHHEVVESAAARCPTVPFRLATIYLDDERVNAFVDGNRVSLGAALQRVTGHAEWGVKAYVGAQQEPAREAGPGRDRPGLAYLTRRREQLHRQETTWATAVRRGDEVHEALTRLSSASVRHPLPGDVPGDAAEVPALIAAYLIKTADGARFAETVHALSGLGGVRLQVTGPWAAYSFVAVEPDGADGRLGGTP